MSTPRDCSGGPNGLGSGRIARRDSGVKNHGSSNYIQEKESPMFTRTPDVDKICYRVKRRNKKVARAKAR